MNLERVTVCSVLDRFAGTDRNIEAFWLAVRGMADGAVCQ